jgi:hypothetical protein
MLCAVPFVVSAEITKQVVVSKRFTPEVGDAKKMDVEPNMVDTMKIRPEIDYTITPRSFASALGTHRFNPASVTYWEHRHNYPFYLKLGVGYPLNSVGDLYGSVHRANVGYLAGYANHYGLYSKLKYKDGFKGEECKDNRSMQMNNKFGIMGGKYFGRYTLAGDLSYRMDLYHRYPLHNQYAEDGSPILEYKRRKIDFDDLNFAVSFGDAFTDYRYLNYKVYAKLNWFNDKSEKFIAGDHYQQMNVNVGAALAREITKRSALTFDLNYDGYYGMKSLKAYKNSIIGADLRYRYRSGGLVDLTAGAKLLYDNNPADTEKQNRWHAFPYLSLSLNVSDKGTFVPYVEVNGELQNNSFYSLARRNPYVAILGGADGSLTAGGVVPNTELYNVRFGVSGHSASSKFAYRFYANMSFMKNAIYWYNINQIFFGVESASRNVWSLCGAVDYKPITQLMITAQLKGALYTNFSTVEVAMPNFEALVRARYTHDKFTVGLSAELIGPTKWTCIQDYSLFLPESTLNSESGVFKTPVSLNLSLYGDYHVSKTCTIYGEVNNILGDVMPTYNWAFYRELGASFTVGIKVLF